MTTSHRRITLLAGASITALGLSALTASPALAAPHDGLIDGTYAGVDTTTTPITICDLADDPAVCFFGVIDTTNPATATLNSPVSGQVFQHGTAAAVTLTATNAAGSSAEFGAIASGTTFASANVTNPIFQSANGVATGIVNFTNDGTLLVDALAVATGGVAGAFASAEAWGAVGQSANATGLASANFVNNGTMTVLASAVATGA